MRHAPRAILAGGLGFAVSFVVACGSSSGLLSGNQSIGLSGQADQISSAVQAGDCGAAINASLALNRAVQTLPATVNPTLRLNLNQGASTIARLAARGCRLRVSSTPSTTTSSSTSSTTPSTSSSTSTSTTTPTTTTTTSSTTTTTTTTATSPTDTGSTSTTTGGVGLGGSTTTGDGNGNGNSGGAGPGNGNSGGPGGGG